MFYRGAVQNTFSFKTAYTYREVSETWGEILPEQHHLRHSDIEALENAKPDDIDFRYVNIYQNNSLIGVMYLQCLNFNSKHYHHNIFDRPVLKQLKQCIVTQSVKLLICGNLFRVNFQGFYFIDKSQREQIFDCLQLYRLETKKENGLCGILLKDCSREFTIKQFTCYQFKSFKQDLTMELDISEDWSSFDDYLNALSRKYRQRAVKIQKSIQTLAMKELGVEELIAEKGRVTELYQNIVQKQSIALGILNAEYFVEMKKNLGDNFRVYGYYLDHKMLAFSSNIYYPNKAKMEIHYIGLDYAHNKQYNLYFNLLFDGIKCAIINGFKTIEMGRTAREAKANAGAHAVENFNYIWVKPGIIRMAFNFIGSWFDGNIGEDWKKRNPFKSSSTQDQSE
jgi:hypothetical protein